MCIFLNTQFILDLYGANNWEAAICDQVLDSIAEVFVALVAYMYTAKTEEEKVHIFIIFLSRLSW